MSDKNGCIWEVLFWFGIFAAMWLYSEHADNKRDDQAKSSSSAYTINHRTIDEEYEDLNVYDRALDEAYEGRSAYDRWR